LQGETRLSASPIGLFGPGKGERKNLARFDPFAEIIPPLIAGAAYYFAG
jgi:hypothetical protein